MAMSDDEDFCAKYQRIRKLQVQTTLLNKIEDLEASIQHLADENNFLKAFIGTCYTQITEWCSPHFKKMVEFQDTIEILTRTNAVLDRKIGNLEETMIYSEEFIVNNRMSMLEKNNSLLEEEIAVLKQSLKDLETTVTRPSSTSALR